MTQPASSSCASALARRVLPLALTLAAVTTPARAQRLDAAPVAARASVSGAAATRPAVAYVFRADSTPTSTTRLVVGGLLGGAAGFVIGAYAGAASFTALTNDDGSESDDWGALFAGVLGAAIGESIGVPIGMHVAARRADGLPLSLGASVLIAAGGIAIATLTAAETDERGEFVVPILVAIPIAQIAAVREIIRSREQASGAAR